MSGRAPGLCTVGGIVAPARLLAAIGLAGFTTMVALAAPGRAFPTGVGAFAAEVSPSPAAATALAGVADTPTIGSPPTGAPPAGEPQRPGVVLLYFFSPDWRPPDFGKLTEAFETAFASGGLDVSFQAFTRYEDFERQVMVKPPTFMIAPAWLDGPGTDRMGVVLRVIARPLRKGKSTYRKALMARSNVDSIDDLATGSIAATVYSMGDGSPEVVLDAFHLMAGAAKVVPVPKDVDALLALNFGQVDAALVTAEQYELLARTNPSEAEKLRVLAFSPEVQLPPVFACTTPPPDRTSPLLDLLARLRDVPEGARVLDMLGFDSFVIEEVADPEPPPPGDPAPIPAPAPVPTPVPTPVPAAGTKAAKTGAVAPGH